MKKAKRVPKLRLKSIEEEAAACRKAFEGFAVGGWVRHCHHQKEIEKLTEPAENRIAYILANKPGHEQPLRLHLFRPETEDRAADYQAKRAPLHAQFCVPGCPWDGSTIFPEAKP